MAQSVYTSRAVCLLVIVGPGGLRCLIGSGSSVVYRRQFICLFDGY